MVTMREHMTSHNSDTLVNAIIYLGCGPLTVTVTTRSIIFLVGDPYKPSFATVTVRGPHPIYIFMDLWSYLVLDTVFPNMLRGT